MQCASDVPIQKSTYLGDLRNDWVDGPTSRDRRRRVLKRREGVRAPRRHAFKRPLVLEHCLVHCHAESLQVRGDLRTHGSEQERVRNGTRRDHLGFRCDLFDTCDDITIEMVVPDCQERARQRGRHKMKTCKELQAINVDLRVLVLRMPGSSANTIPGRARFYGAQPEPLEIVNQTSAASQLSDGVLVFSEVDAEELERVSKLGRPPVAPNGTDPFDYSPGRQRRSRGAVGSRKNGAARPRRSRLGQFLCVSAEE